eukprot:jgi/Antlo1/752/267
MSLPSVVGGACSASLCVQMARRSCALSGGGCDTVDDDVPESLYVPVESVLSESSVHVVLVDHRDWACKFVLRENDSVSEPLTEI